MGSGPMPVGPIEVLVLQLDEPKFDGSIADEIVRLEEAGVANLIDAAVVLRESEDEFTGLDIDAEILPGRAGLGAIVGALVGLGAAGEEGAVEGALVGAATGIDPVSTEDLWDIAESLPIGSAAAVIVLEHAWATGLMGAIRDSGGTVLDDGMVHAEDLIAAGIVLGDVMSEEG